MRVEVVFAKMFKEGLSVLEKCVVLLLLRCVVVVAVCGRLSLRSPKKYS